MNPYDFPDAYFYSTLANFRLGNLDAAEKSAQDAIKANAEQRFPAVENILGLVFAQQGNYKEAHEHLTKYLEIAPQASNASLVQQQIKQLEQALAAAQ